MTHAVQCASLCSCHLHTWLSLLCCDAVGQDEFRQEVAIKVFNKAALSRSRHQLLQVEKEINALRVSSHPNVVQFYDVLETDEHVYLVMEHLPHGELYDYILDKGRLDEVEAGRLFGQVISAIAHIHQHGIVHRGKHQTRVHAPPTVCMGDCVAQCACVAMFIAAAMLTLVALYSRTDLKPENILLDKSFNIKLVDFGLANIFTVGDFHSKTLRTQCGSPHVSTLHSTALSIRF